MLPLPDPLAFATTEVHDPRDTGQMETGIATQTLNDIVSVKREDCVSSMAGLAHEALAAAQLTGPNVVDAVFVSLSENVQQLAVACLESSNGRRKRSENCGNTVDTGEN